MCCIIGRQAQILSPAGTGDRYNDVMKLFFASLALSLSLPAFSHQVVGVNDGETLTLLVDEKPLKVRLANIDAPEMPQAYGRASRKSLYDLCFGKDASYRALETDHYGSPVAVVSCGGIEANRAQIERGMAWVADKSNRDFTLPALQLIARRDRKGLWADDNPVPPWEFRRPKIRKASAPRTDEMTDPAICFVDRRGEYRIINGAKRYGC